MNCNTIILLIHGLTAFCNALEIYQYKTPIVSLKMGNGWIADGSFKLVHVINLDEYMTTMTNISLIVEKHIPPSKNKEFILHHLMRTKERLSELMNIRKRTPRSIDWIGSAWKWVAGSPDAADWNEILTSQENIINNNNEQYKINKDLQRTTNQVVQKINEIVARLNNVTSGKDFSMIEQITINELVILKEEVNEIIRACQLAKEGIINTNLLNQREINEILDEVEGLPYTNVIEAVEYGTPCIYTNGSLLLYTLSMPKLSKTAYNQILIKAAIHEGKQIDLAFDKILADQAETYGIKDNCLSINNSTVCQRSALTKLAEDDCLVRILKGGSTKCKYKLNHEEVVELLMEDVIYVTNFKGSIETNGEPNFLNGTYLLRLFNESIVIKNQTYSSTSITRTQALPPVLANITHDDILLDINYVHEVSLSNINRLNQLGTKFNHSFGINIFIVGLMVSCIWWLWYQQTKKLNLPRIDLHSSTNNPVICGTQTFKEGGVNNIDDTAGQVHLAVSA